MKRLFSTDPITGERTYFISHGDGSFSIQTQADVTPMIENNKALYNHDDGGWSRDRQWRRAASIPNAVIHQWMTQYGVNVFNKDHAGAVKRLLNSSEWQALRTAPGRI